MSPASLHAALASAEPPLVVDVRLPEDFAEAKIRGAISNPVFEVAFAGRLPEQLPDLARPVCVYGTDGISHEAQVAEEKLRRAGYTNVSTLEGGLAAWRKAGLPLEVGPPAATVTLPRDGVRLLDLRESRIGWTGRNLLNKHSGEIGLKEGRLEFSAGSICGGTFILDMTDIRCRDLAGTPLHDVLVHHLQDADFFDVERFPEARFTIDAASLVPGAAPGSPNLRVSGPFTLRGVTHPLVLFAAAGVTVDGRPAAQATFSLDRTEWGVIYGSGKYFRRLAGHLVNDLIEIELRLVTL